MNKLISVIIPCYNASKTLNRTLTSLNQQDYKNLQIILVNDGSKDNSLDIAREFASKDSRMLVIDQPNQGVAVARNTGLSKAIGDYIMFLDADDNYTSDSSISKMVELLEKENADQVVCNFTHPCFEQFTPSRTFDFNNKQDFMDFYQDHFLHGVPWNKITKRECLTEPFVPKIIFEDVMYNLANFHNIRKVVSTSEVLYNYYCAPKKPNEGLSVINTMYAGEFWKNPQTIWYKIKDNKSIIDGYLARYPSDWQDDMRYTRYFDYLFFDLFFMFTIKEDSEHISLTCNKIFEDDLWKETFKSKEKYGLKLRKYDYEDIRKFIKLSYISYTDIKENKKSLSTLLVGIAILANIFFDYSSNLDTIDLLAKTYKEYVEQSTDEARYVKKLFEDNK